MSLKILIFKTVVTLIIENECRAFSFFTICIYMINYLVIVYMERLTFAIAVWRNSCDIVKIKDLHLCIDASPVSGQNGEKVSCYCE